MSFVDDLNNLDFEELIEAPPLTRAIIMLILIAIICVLAYFFLLSPMIDKLQQKQNIEAQKKKDFEWKQGIAANREAYENQIEEVEKSLEEVNRLLPEFQNKEEIIISLTNFALKHELIGQTIQPLDETIKTYYAELPYNIEVTGSYSSLGKFVADIASLKRIVTLHDFVIKKGKKGKSADETLHHLHFTLKAKTYRLIKKASKKGNKQ